MISAYKLMITCIKVPRDLHLQIEKPNVFLDKMTLCCTEVCLNCAEQICYYILVLMHYIC